MNSNYCLTEAEQKVLDKAHQMLGDNLSRFLLSGLGEDYRSAPRVFCAQRTKSACQSTKYYFQIASRNPLGLPTGHDPLILATILQVLDQRKNTGDEVIINDEMILSQLHWLETQQSKQSIRGAIERYFFTSYYLIDKELSKSECIEGLYSSCRRFLTGYEIIHETVLGHPELTFNSMAVKFTAGFEQDIATPKKYFFNLDFEALQSLRQVM